MEKYFSLLQKTPLFQQIDRDDLAKMLDCLQAHIRAFRRGQSIFSPGDPAGQLGLVLEGQVQIVIDDILGNRSILGACQPGQLFGEAFCCAGVKKLPVAVEAKSDCRVMFLDYQRVINSCGNGCAFHARMVENMVKILAGKNILLNSKLRHVSQRSTREKLLSYLTEQAAAHGAAEFDIPFDRQELADYLCVERSAMSAELSRLVREGLLETRRSHFRFLT